MVSEEVKWPVTVIDVSDPALKYVAPNLYELGCYVESWHSTEEGFADENDEDIVLTDALGRKLDGRIERLTVIELLVASGSDVNRGTQ